MTAKQQTTQQQTPTERFNSQCNEYLRRVFPEAGEQQLLDLRTTFYAGAWELMTTNAQATDDESRQLCLHVHAEMTHRYETALAQIKAMGG